MALKKALGFLITAALSISCFPTTVQALTEGTAEPGTETTASPDSTPEVTADPSESPASTAAVSADPAASTDAGIQPSAGTETDTASAAPATSAPAASSSPESADEEFPGMPDNYELTSDQEEIKALMTGADEVETAASAVSGTDYVPQQIVYLADTQDYAETVSEAYGAQLLSFESGVAVAELPEGVSVADAVRAAADPDTNLPAVDPNYLMTEEEPVEVEDSSFDSLSALGLVNQIPVKSMWADYASKDPFLQITSPKYQYFLENADVYDAWGTTKGSSEIRVAVLDSGINSSQEDLKNRISIRETASGTGITASHYTAGDHGTHVAGIIGASNGNGLGGSGIAPGVTMGDFQCLSNQMYASEATNFSVVLAKYNDAVAWNADIINESMAGVGFAANEQAAITAAAQKGIVTVVAAGNEGTNRKLYPAGYDNVICVGALNYDNSQAEYSDYGAWVDISAPGTGLWSTAAGGTTDSSKVTTYDYTKVSDYQFMSGTSMAAPVVSGCIALYMSAAGNRNGDVNGDGVQNAKDYAQVEAVLKKTAQKTGLTNMGAGCVDAGAMVSTVIAAPTISATVAGSAVTDFSKTIVVPASGTSQLVLDSTMATYYIAYTTDGTTPAVKDGQLTNGVTYTGPLSLNSFADGALTVKAVAVNGEGQVSAVKSIKMTLQHTATGAANKITIGGPLYIGLGKSAQLTATLLDGSKTGVTWSVVSASDKATISSSGLLKTGKAAAAGDTITVRAASKANPALANTYTVKVTSLITSVTLAASNGMQNGGTIANSTAVTLIPTVLAGTANASGYTLEWKSSNPKIATVSSKGVVNPVGKGTVTITAKATDGSGKSGMFKLNVQMLAVKLQITPATSEVALGKSVKFTADVEPASAANHSVTWSIDDAALAQKVKISSSGVLSVPAKAAVSKVTVTAVTKDGTNIKATSTIQVRSAAAAKVTMALVSKDLSHGTFSKTNLLQGITLFTSNPAGNAYAKLGSNAMSVTLAASADNHAAVSYTSSNPSVATVNGAVVTAVREGKTTITATAQDGSGKKASVTVNVIVPASGITVGTKSAICLETASEARAEGKLYVAAGKSAVLTARLGTLYGKPTVKKVQWTVDDTAKSKGVTISDTGTLKVPAALNTWLTEQSDKDEPVEINVTATTTDGSNQSYQYPVRLTGKTTKLAIFKPGSRFTVYSSESDSASTSEGQQQWYYEVGSAGDLYFYSDSPSKTFTFAGAVGKLNFDSSDYGFTGYYVKVGKQFYKLYGAHISVDIPSVTKHQFTSGSLKITAADGTGISASASVKVWN